MNNSILSTLLKGTPVSGAALGLLLAVGMAPQVVGQECPEVLRHEMRALQTGNIQNLCEYQGKVVLVVNTASFYAYTDQYEALEAVYRQYRDEGLVVLGFPTVSPDDPTLLQQVRELLKQHASHATRL